MNVGLHGTRIVPISETQSVMCWPSAKINNKGEDDQTHNSDNLNTGKTKLSLSVDGNCEDVQADDQDDNYRDPSRDVDANSSIPELDDDCGRRDLSAEGYGRIIPILI